MNSLPARPLKMQFPRTLVWGPNCTEQFIEDLRGQNLRRVLLVTARPLQPLTASITAALQDRGISAAVDDTINQEPTIEMLESSLERSRTMDFEAVIGLGGGSVLDTAKLIAALARSRQKPDEVFGIGKLTGRTIRLVCLPTTSGTGSEVSPNAILVDRDKKKKGVISEFLVPDAAYVDPLLTRTVPPPVTAATGMDALVHCIEAYANRGAHPMTDLYALEGIRLIAGNLKTAVENGQDLQARSALSLGSLYGGLCLGPVNTAAVHALAYPLGGEFHISHGLSNAVLLPYVMDFTLSAAPARYAQIAEALGVRPAATEEETARRGAEAIRQLCAGCRIPLRLSELGLPKTALEKMAESAMTVTRLLKNNLREVTYEDAVSIYRKAW
ncbi:MAG TPA: iron-containing alcohol dehydrogenase [Anaerohalosphaeraceae bacterium]|mgnify:FL=1|nr:iron-containing alcohol dehydrogenase [Anaerohalosphaeraceae bacterium]HOL89500.1 iron-containing alcohol dehydrogenase [Anaerohalosphaeraceae bacterium]HPP57111.1 iron-containing alcohol dehydrogenase [Anaerohalosphaeraceae bacterium]